MARTPSNMIPLGDVAPFFTLHEPLTGNEIALGDIRGEKGTLVIFMCNHCPYVLHVIDEIVKIGKEYSEKGIGIAAINSNDVEKYPDDSPENMALFAKKHDLNFPYVFDETQEIAQYYDAACTPDFYLYDTEMRLVYRGQLDDSRPFNDQPVDGKDLRAALENLLHGLPTENQKPSLGCNIKWKE